MRRFVSLKEQSEMQYIKQKNAKAITARTAKIITITNSNVERESESELDLGAVVGL